jgi:bifunctional non-homologous end joining protein LigD
MALETKTYFDEVGLTSFVKISGKTGMHLLLPCSSIEYSHTRIIAESICDEIHERVAKISTPNTSTHSRAGKVYIDASQNDYGDRLVAPYCVRAYKQPYVSMPLSWDEVNSKLDRHGFKMDIVKQRMEQTADPFENLFDQKIQKHNSKLLMQFLEHSLST